jgi:Na+/phosphate symporter
MLIILVSLLVLIVGALYYLFNGNPKRAQLGLVAFAVGLFWFVGQIASTHLHFLDGLR